jgi:O-antigen ligase
LIGLREFRTERVLWNGHVPSFLLPHDDIVMRILAGSSRATTGDYRAQSVFTTSLGFSELMALAIPFPLHFAVSNTSRLWVRIAGAFSIPFMVIVILDTGSRLGLLGFFLTTMIYLFLWALRLQRQRPGSLLAPTILVAYPALFSAFIVLSFVVGRIKAKVWGMGQFDDSNQARIDQWHMGIPKIITHPFGHGVGTGAEVLGYFNLGGTLTIDSYYLLVVLEYGIVGFIAFFAIFVVSALHAGWYSLRSNDGDRDVAFLLPLAASVASFLAMKTFFAQDDNNPIVFMMVGIIVALIHRLKSREAQAAASPAASHSQMAGV